MRCPDQDNPLKQQESFARMQGYKRYEVTVKVSNIVKWFKKIFWR